jgi:MerR family mercuric resistance operon transcriptional regulator
MRIGELSRRSGVPVETIRYYERLRLLSIPARTASGYRSYSPAALESLRFIKLTQSLGFALKEISDLLKLHTIMAALPAERCATSGELRSMVQLAAAKRGEIEEKITALRELSDLLGQFISGLEQRPEPICPGSSRVQRATADATAAGSPCGNAKHKHS